MRIGIGRWWRWEKPCFETPKFGSIHAARAILRCPVQFRQPTHRCNQVSNNVIRVGTLGVLSASDPIRQHPCIADLLSSLFKLRPFHSRLSLTSQLTTLLRIKPVTLSTGFPLSPSRPLEMAGNNVLNHVFCNLLVLALTILLVIAEAEGKGQSSSSASSSGSSSSGSPSSSTPPSSGSKTSRSKARIAGYVVGGVVG